MGRIYLTFTMAKNFSEQDIERIAIRAIRKFFGSIVGADNLDIQWLNAKEAAKQLGYGSNVRSLYHLKDSGVLRVGKEIQDRRPAGSSKGDYYFNLKACEKRLNTPPEKRAN